MSLMQEKTSQYVASFEAFEREAAHDGGRWLHGVRKEAIARFAKRGFPTMRDEEWRFTNIAPIVNLPFKPVLQRSHHGLTCHEVDSLSFQMKGRARLVFVNGHYAEDLSSRDTLPQGVTAGNLAAALATDSALVEKHLARYARGEDNAFCALSAAFMLDGAFVHVVEGTAVEEPIYLLFIAAPPETGAALHPRNLIVVERDSKAHIVEHYVSLGEGGYLTNAVTEIIAGENSRVEHCKVQDESPEAFHVATIQGQLHANSYFKSQNIALGSKLSRNDVRMKLDGEGVECTLNGLYVVGGKQHVDNHTFLEHAKPSCASHELYKGILGGNASGVFKGKILVRPGAQKTDAKQTNNNLLLSDTAVIDTMPQLEIFADDVKCTHGATVGQLSEDAIFYLRSRGIHAVAARNLLVRAFAGDVIERIESEPVREALSRRMNELLQGRLQTGEA